MNRNQVLINELKDTSYSIEKIRSKLRAYGVERADAQKIVAAITAYRNKTPGNSPSAVVKKSKTMIAFVVAAMILAMTAGIVAFMLMPKD